MSQTHTGLSEENVSTAANYTLKVKVKLVNISTQVILFSSARDENG